MLLPSKYFLCFFDIVKCVTEQKCHESMNISAPTKCTGSYLAHFTAFDGWIQSGDWNDSRKARQ